MSLTIGAMVTAGVAAYNFVFDYTKADYEAKTAKLESLVKELDNSLSELKRYRQTVPNFWDDDEAKETCGALDATIRRIEFEMDRAKGLINVYKEAIAEFDNNKITAKNLVREAMGILDSLGD